MNVKNIFQIIVFVTIFSHIINNVYGMTANQTFSVNVPQLEELQRLVENSNHINENLFYGSMAIVGITLVASFLSVMYVRRQAKTMEEESRQRLRPWMIINSPIPFQVELPNGNLRNYDDVAKEIFSGRDITVKAVKMSIKVT